MHDVGHFRNGLQDARGRIRGFERDTLTRLAAEGRDIELAFRSLAETAGGSGVASSVGSSSWMKLRADYPGSHVVGPVLSLAWRGRSHHFGLLVQGGDPETYAVVSYCSLDVAQDTAVSVSHDTVEAFFRTLTEAVARLQAAWHDIDREDRINAPAPSASDGWVLACFAALVVAEMTMQSVTVATHIQTYANGPWLIGFLGLAAVWAMALGGLARLRDAYVSRGRYRFGLMHVGLATGLLSVPAVAFTLPPH